MAFVEQVLALLHLLGMAAIIGSFFISRDRVTPAMLWGARAQIITGLLLVGVVEAGTEPVNHAKIGVKILVALAVTACAEIANAKQKRGEHPGSLPTIAGALAILNAAVATLWVAYS